MANDESHEDLRKDSQESRSCWSGKASEGPTLILTLYLPHNNNCKSVFNNNKILQGKKGSGFIMRLNRVLFPDDVEVKGVLDESILEHDINLKTQESLPDVSRLDECFVTDSKQARSRLNVVGCNSLANLSAPLETKVKENKEEKDRKRKERIRRRANSSLESSRRLNGISVLDSLDTCDSTKINEPNLITIQSTKEKSQKLKSTIHKRGRSKSRALQKIEDSAEGNIECSMSKNISSSKNVNSKGKIREKSLENSHRLSGMDILASLEPIICNQNNEIGGGSNVRKVKTLARSKSCGKENIHPSTCYVGKDLRPPTHRRTSLLSATSIFERLPASIVTPSLSPPISSDEGHDQKNTERQIASSSVAEPISPPKLSKSQTLDSTESMPNHEVLNSEIDEVDEVCFLSPSIAPKPSKRQDTRSTPKHMNLVNGEKSKVKLQRNEEEKTILSPYMNLKSLKRMDTKTNPVHHDSMCIGCLISMPTSINEPDPSTKKQQMVSNNTSATMNNRSSDIYQELEENPSLKQGRVDHSEEYIKKGGILGSKSDRETILPKNDEIVLSAVPKQNIPEEIESHDLCAKVSATGWTKLILMNGNDINDCSVERTSSGEVDSSLEERDTSQHRAVAIVDKISETPKVELIDNPDSISKVRRSSRTPRTVDRLSVSFKRRRKAKKVNKTPSRQGKSPPWCWNKDLLEGAESPADAILSTPRRDLSDDVESTSSIRRSSRVPRTIERLSISFRRRGAKKSKKLNKPSLKIKNEADVPPGGSMEEKSSTTPEAHNDADAHTGRRRSSRTPRTIDRLTISFRRKKKANKSNATVMELQSSISIDASGNGCGTKNEKMIADILAQSSGVSKSSKRPGKISNRGKNAMSSKINPGSKKSSVKSPEADISKSQEIVEAAPGSNDVPRRSTRKSIPVKRLEPTFKRKRKSKRKDGSPATINSTAVQSNEQIASKEEKDIPTITVTENTYEHQNIVVEEVDSTAHTVGWSETNIAKLKEAHKEVNPLSSFFWQNVASKVPGMTAEECRDRWFALGSPTVRRKKKSLCKVDGREAKASDSDSETEDDIFNSTPVRNGEQLFGSLMDDMNTPNLNTTEKSKNLFAGIFSVSDMKEKKKLVQPNESNTFISPLATRRLGKSYIRALRAGFVCKSKASKTKKGKSLEKDHDVIESIQCGDVQLGGVLSPGGTLFIEGPDDDDDDDIENMYISGEEE